VSISDGGVSDEISSVGATVCGGVSSWARDRFVNEANTKNTNTVRIKQARVLVFFFPISKTSLRPDLQKVYQLFIEKILANYR
jgi:hypothetical protein